jgi:choline/glycine/proline betaine transport protein
MMSERITGGASREAADPPPPDADGVRADAPPTERTATGEGALGGVLPEAPHAGPDPQVAASPADTDEEIVAKLKAQGVRLGRFDVAPAVFWPSLVVVVAVTALAVLLPEGTGRVLTSIQDWIVTHLGWYYMLAIAAFIVFAILICFSRYGGIRLGRDGEKAEFGMLTWFCMLFAAGMGIGLVFYGVGEPLTYATLEPKPGWTGDETEQAKLAMAQTVVHWGLHPWAIYAVIGLAIAYTIHRRGRPISIRWALEPLFGDRVKGWVGDLFDILAIFGTLFGVATSLGLGVQQIAAGLSAIGIVDRADNTLLVILIVVITFIATGSVVSGVGKGMKWLSNINLSMAGILLITMLLLGPTLFLFQNFIESIGVYLANVLHMTFDVGAYTGAEGAAWGSKWTIFYWGWWISWAPFVGVFIARISRGRTVREFIAGVMLVPTIVGFFWFSVMGGLGLHRQLFGDGDLVQEGDEEVSVESALFDVIGALPLGEILSVVAILLIAIFFITSSDSGSMVIDMLASGGHPNPPTWSRVLFSFLEGAVAIALLLAGGLGALQAAALATALPFSAVLLLMCVATLRSLRADQAERDREATMDRYRRLASRLSEDFDVAFGENVDTRVDSRIDYRLRRTRGWEVTEHREGRPAPAADGGTEPPRAPRS